MTSSYKLNLETLLQKAVGKEAAGRKYRGRSLVISEEHAEAGRTLADGPAIASLFLLVNETKQEKKDKNVQEPLGPLGCQWPVWRTHPVSDLHALERSADDSSEGLIVLPTLGHGSGRKVVPQKKSILEPSVAVERKGTDKTLQLKENPSLVLHAQRELGEGCNNKSAEDLHGLQASRSKLMLEENSSFHSSPSPKIRKASTEKAIRRGVTWSLVSCWLGSLQ